MRYYLKTARIFVLDMIFVLCLGSCVGDVDFASGYEKKVVVNCVLKNRDVQHLSLTYNKPLGSNAEAEKITEAKASLWNADTDTKVGEFEYNGKDWTLVYTPLGGVRYRLEIDGIKGQPHIEAETEFQILINRDANIDYGKYRLMKTGPHPVVWRGDGYYDDDGVFRLIPSVGYHYFYSMTGNESGYDGAADRFNETGEIRKVLLFPKVYVYVPVYKYLIRFFDNRDSDVREKEGFFYFDYSVDYPRYHYAMYPSKEYDKYLKLLITNFLEKENEDDILTRFNESVNYCNIKNGLGLFASCQEYFYKTGVVLI